MRYQTALLPDAAPPNRLLKDRAMDPDHRVSGKYSEFPIVSARRHRKWYNGCPASESNDTLPSTAEAELDVMRTGEW